MRNFQGYNKKKQKTLIILSNNDMIEKNDKKFANKTFI